MLLCWRPVRQTRRFSLALFLAALFVTGGAPVGSDSVAHAQRARPARAKKAKAARGARPAARSSGRTRAVDAPAAKRANALRRQADSLAKDLRGARSSQRDARKYVKRRLDTDARQIFDALAKTQAQGGLDPVTEHRAMAAAYRVLAAAHELDPKLIDSKLVDSLDAMYGSAAYRRRAKTHETSVELESSMTNKILDAITTPDGTVGPILREGGNQAPAFLASKARGGDVASVKWDSLDRGQKLELLRSQSAGRSFFSNRRIPGAVFRRELGKSRASSVELGGRTAGVGSDKVDVDGVLMQKVEYMGPKNVDDVSGVEMHVRQPGNAARNARDAFTVVDLVDSKTKQGHQHIPYRIPTQVRRGDAVARAKLVDFYRRVNMVAELRVVRDGYLLKPVKDGSVVYFDFLHGNGLGQLNDHFAAYAKNGRGSLSESALKMGAVGFRTGELYGDQNMFGFEVRVLNKRRAGEGDPFLDRIQKGVLTASYGMKPSEFQAWHDDHIGADADVRTQSSKLGALHYNRPVRSLLGDAPRALQGELTPEVRQALEAKAEEHYGLKMLVHDWSSDPALRGRPDVQRKVVEAQKQGLRQLRQGGDADQISKQFAQSSGLYEAFAGSIGLADPR